MLDRLSSIFLFMGYGYDAKTQIWLCTTPLRTEHSHGKRIILPSRHPARPKGVLSHFCSVATAGLFITQKYKKNLTPANSLILCDILCDITLLGEAASYPQNLIFAVSVKEKSGDLCGIGEGVGSRVGANVTLCFFM